MIQLRSLDTLLDLPQSGTITRDIETRLINRELDVGDLTFPFDIPKNESSLRFFGLVDHIGLKSYQREWEMDLIVNGFYIDRVFVALQKVTDVITVNIIGTWGAFARAMGSKQLRELELGGIRTIGSVNALPTVYSVTLPIVGTVEVSYYGCDSTIAHMNAVAQEAIVTDYVFGPTMDEGANLENSHADWDSTNYLNYWHHVDQTFIDPVQFRIEDYFNSSIATTALGWWVPFFRLVFVVKKCFEEAGFTVTGDFFTDANLQRIVLINTYAINRCAVQYTGATLSHEFEVRHQATYIDPRNHMPAGTVVEFLTEVSKAFNLRYDLSLVSKTVRVEPLQVESMTAIDLTDRVDPEPEIVYERADYQRGFSFAFEFDGADAQSGTEVVDKDIGAVHASVNLHADLGAVTGHVIGSIVYLRDVNEYVRWSGLSWEFYSVGHAEFRTSSEPRLQDVRSKCVPVRQKRLWFGAFATLTGEETPAPMTRIGICGAHLFYTRNFADAYNEGRMAGAFGVESVGWIDIQPHLVNWLGIRQSAENSNDYPYLSAVPADPVGNPISGPVATVWHTPDGKGLADVFWAPLYNRLKDSIRVKWSVLLTPQDLYRLDVHKNTIMVRGQLFAVEKARLVLPFPSINQLETVRV